VRNNIDFIADRLGTGLDYQIGLMPLDYQNSGPRILSPATDSLPFVHSAVAKLNTSGNGELGPDAIVSAFDSRTGLRPEAAACLVLVADEPTQWYSHTVEDAAQALADNDATLFSIVTISSGASYQQYPQLATDSGGAVFNISAFVSDPQPLLDALTTQCVASVAERPDLSVVVDDGLDQLALDESGTHVVEVSNDGLVDATGVEVSLELSEAASVGAVFDGGVVSALPGGGTRVVWPLFGLAAGASKSLTVSWTAAASAQAGDVVSVVARAVDDGVNGADLSPANNQASDSTVFVAVPIQVVSVRWVDDEDAGAEVAPVAGARAVLTGPRLTPVGFSQGDAQAGVPAGYVFVSLDNVDLFDDDDSRTQVITVHLAHRHTLSTVVSTRTVEYVGAGSSTPGPVSHDVLWRVDSDELTGVRVFSSDSGYPEVVSPVVGGFTASPLAVAATLPVVSTLVAPSDSLVTVVYLAGSAQSVSVRWVDDEDGGAEVAPVAGTRTVLTGARLTPVGFTQGDAEAGAPAGYVFVSLDNVDLFDDDDSRTQVITVHLAHRHTASTLVSTRTVEYVGAGSSTPPAVSHDVLWRVDLDEVTGVRVFSSDSGYPEVVSPVVAGFTASPLAVAATLPVVSTLVAPSDSLVTVVYVPGSAQVVSVRWVDDDAAGVEVAPAAGARTVLTGARLTPVGFSQADAEAGAPAGYVFVSLENVDLFDDDDSRTQVITVHLAHHHTLSTLVVVRTVEYVGAGGDTPGPVGQEVLWHVDVDDVTGVALYWSDEGYPEVVSPDVEGHVVDRELVGATRAVRATTEPPRDTVELVEYAPVAQPAPPTPTPTPTPSVGLPVTGPIGLSWMTVAAACLIGLGTVLAGAHATRRRRTTDN
jgi:hypothetical protein